MQREDQAIGVVVVRLVEGNRVVDNDTRRATNESTRKLLHEWGKLNLEDWLLY